MHTHGIRSSEIPQAVQDAIRALEADHELQVWICSDQQHADQIQHLYPGQSIVTFQPWQVPTEYSGSFVYMNARASEDGGQLVDCYQLTDTDSAAYHVPWIKKPAGTVRPWAVYDFLGIQRIGKWSDAMLEGLVTAPILRAADLDPDGWDESQAQRVQRAFEKYARKNREVSIERANQQLEETKQEIGEFRRLLGQAVITLIDRQQAVVGLEGEDERGDRLVREYELLAAHSRVHHLGFIGTSLRITTTDDLRLWSTDRKVSRWLGRFLISIDLASCEVKLKNLDTARGGSDHPHVTDGVVCWGDYEARVAEMVGRGDLLTLFEWLLQFIETYNPSDYYSRYARWWLDAPDERPLETSTKAVANAMVG